MKNHFLYVFLVVLVFFTTLNSLAQNTTFELENQANIAGLSIYPNPVSSNKGYIYITSKYDSKKKVTLYTVLGKHLFSVALTNNELNISNLSKGVYILKITQNNLSETRKLVIK